MKRLIIVAVVLMLGCGPDAAPPTIPTVVDVQVASITSVDASGAAYIQSDGGSPITQHGLVWSTSPAPALPGATSTQEGPGGTGLFLGDIEGLTSKTKYYLRAYATNKVGTAYSEEITFTTL